MSKNIRNTKVAPGATFEKLIGGMKFMIKVISFKSGYIEFDILKPSDTNLDGRYDIFLNSILIGNLDLENNDLSFLEKDNNCVWFSLKEKE